MSGQIDRDREVPDKIADLDTLHGRNLTEAESETEFHRGVRSHSAQTYIRPTGQSPP
jgi:hypothetical protein